MQSFVKVCASLFLLTFFITGCSKETNPTPNDTVLGSPTSPGNRPDWINDGSGLYDGGGFDTGGPGGAYDEGLELRDVSLGGGNDEVIDSIYFGYDESSIRSSERTKLENVAEMMQANPASRLVTEGNTDWYGTTEYNLSLADRRANAVKTYLVQLGINPDRIDILALGELEADQDLPKDDPAVIDDRRVDLILING